MWWNRKKEETDPVYVHGTTNQEGIAKLVASRKAGETFTYMGVTLMVTGHYEAGICGVCPRLRCDYVDTHGVLHSVSFGVSELPALERASAG